MMVKIQGQEGAEALPLNLSRTGVLLDSSSEFHVADPVAMRLVRGGRAEGDDAWTVSGRVVRVESDPGRPGRAMIGVAFDAPISEERLMARVSLSRTPQRPGRGLAR
jgi:hypothetical protein